MQVNPYPRLTETEMISRFDWFYQTQFCCVFLCAIQGGFPFVVPLILLPWNYEFLCCFFFEGKTPWISTLHMYASLSLSPRVQALRMYERCIELSPNSKNPSQNRLLALNYLSGSPGWVGFVFFGLDILVKWSFDSCFWWKFWERLFMAKAVGFFPK